MTTYVNAGDFPVHVGGLSVGVNATVTRAEPLEDDSPYDRGGVSVVLFPGDSVDTDVELNTGSLVDLTPPKPRGGKKTDDDAPATDSADSSAPTETE